MIRGKLIHPEILAALASCRARLDGADLRRQLPPRDGPVDRGAKRVYLNLSPGLLTVSQVLDVLVEAIPIERAALMIPQEPGAPTPDAHADLLAACRRASRSTASCGWTSTPRPTPRTLALVIATGDLRLYANVLLTIGVIAAGGVAAVGSSDPARPPPSDQPSGTAFFGSRNGMAAVRAGQRPPSGASISSGLPGPDRPIGTHT